MKMILAAAGCLLAAGAAEACPDYTQWGVEQYELTAADLYSPKFLNVQAGGDYNLERCNIRAGNWSGPMPGFVIKEPDFSITIRGMAGYQLEFRTESKCDSVLLINTAGANWYYDDDDNGNSDARIRLTRPAGDGIYDVWIGTYDGAVCDARLIIETF
ncbi:MAG: hypothetical protein H5U20_02070 [Rhodobacteraceae bacterium]|nr:hypothetical protein [Paracoccaceae bacterium]